MGLELEYLNHASVLLRIGSVALLSDPWYAGPAFSGGWGLRYHNPEALQRAAQASHLWISHWHSDHLSMPSLRALAARNPRMEVLANESANFTMAERLRSAGFRNVRTVRERRTERLGSEGAVEVTRYPTAGIDNMLHVRGEGWSVLNYNDCNLPRAAIRSLCHRIGGVDLLLTNYNHAGKLFSRGSPSEEKEALFDVLGRTVETISPRWVVPFASSHYYRAPASVDQNASLIEFDELEDWGRSEGRCVVLRIGDRASFFPGRRPEVVRRAPPLEPVPPEVHEYDPPVAWDELSEAATQRCQSLHKRYFGLTRALPRLRVEVIDHGRTLELDPARGARQSSASPDIAAHSRAVYDWLARRFGDDTFVAGAHFELRSADTSAIERWALITLLDASHLDPRHVLGYLASADGRRFLWARREEVVATLLGRRFVAGRMRI